MDDLQKKVDAELDRALTGLSQHEVGSDEYGKATNNFEKLYRMRMDEHKNNAEYWFKHDTDEINRRDQNKDRIVGYVFDGVKLAGYAGLFLMGLKYEEKGTLASIFTRNHSSKLKL